MKSYKEHSYTLSENLSRRQFLEAGVTSTAAICLGCGKASGRNASATDVAPKEARFYEKLPNKRVVCHVCPNECVIADSHRGMCGTRENRGGTLFSLVYGKIVAENIDPVEKKPFYHVVPGSRAYSIATAGCNMWCKFCQNFHISQSKPEELRSIDFTPEDVAARAKRAESKLIAYTYNEPTVFTEFVYDCSRAGLRAGVHSVVVSNGYINAEPLEKLADVITAYKVDFKSFSKTFYREVTGGRRDPVMETIKRLKKLGVWMELVHLTIPTLNDDEASFKGMADWLMGEVGPDVPVHFSRFHPMYRLTNLPVTPVSTLEMARNILMDRGIKFVYIGNVPGHPGDSTYCPNCGKNILERTGYRIGSVRIEDGKCSYCSTPIPGVWSL
ncbi:AmmeMemoRadiSam system radical SAM enzyme [Candidatus Latescibacterota bacterium]